MANKVIRQWSRNGKDYVDVGYKDNGDSTYSLLTISETKPDLKLGAKSLSLTLSSGSGSVEIPDTATVVGVCPSSSTSIRIGLEAPEANGTKTGAAVESDLKKGVPVLASVYTWFNIGIGENRILYVSGGNSDVVEIVVR